MRPRGSGRPPAAFFPASSGPAASWPACFRASSWHLLLEISDLAHLPAQQVAETLHFGVVQGAARNLVFGLGRIGWFAGGGSGTLSGLDLYLHCAADNV